MSLPENWLEELQKIYPRRTGGQGWGALPRLIQKILARGGTWPQLLAGAKSYRNHCDREGLTGTSYVRQARTFFGPDDWWNESYEPEAVPKLPHQVMLERRWQALKDRAYNSDFRQPTTIEMKCDPSAFESQLARFESFGSNVTPIGAKVKQS